jgi:protein-S-isoprenylcysteine O-methyltransferase Ste14
VGHNGAVSTSRGGDVGSPRDNQRLVGWALVIIQIILLVLFVLLPKRRGLLMPPDVLDVLGIVLMVGGLAVVIISLIRLGGAVTPTPVPQENSSLRTGGIYAIIRHPIYVGILIAALGFTLAVGSLWQVMLLAILMAFFYAKAFWEDRLLAERYGVAWFDYADHVGGFFPHLRSNR